MQGRQLGGYAAHSCELDPQATVVSLDGRSAYDCISRAAVLTKLREVAPALLPFARAMYARRSELLWWDANGEARQLFQSEGVEQGDPLAPAFYALGQHNAFLAANAALQPGDSLFTFLDDLYLVTTPERARSGGDTVAGAVEREAGVAANVGKTRVYHAAGGPAPPGVDELGEEVWRGNKPPPERGFLALGIPIGHDEYVRTQARERLREAREFLQAVPRLPDLQCAWLLLLFCASPRAQYLLGNVPPELAADYARSHDDEVWRTLLELLGGLDPEDAASHQHARDIAFLPARLGGLGPYRPGLVGQASLASVCRQSAAAARARK